MLQSFDSQLATIWNDMYPNSQVAPEHFWDVCRELSSHAILQADMGAVSAIQIGPFHIATKLNAQKKDILSFFLENIFPALITKVGKMTFNEAYPIYIIPAFKALIFVLDHVYVIKDIGQWDMLTYIRNANEAGIFPTSTEIAEEWAQRGYSQNAEDTLLGLRNIKSSLGTADELITIDDAGRIHSLV